MDPAASRSLLASVDATAVAAVGGGSSGAATVRQTAVTVEANHTAATAAASRCRQHISFVSR